MTYHQLEMKTEKGKKKPHTHTHTGPVMNRVTYTRSSLEMGTCSLSHMNTYLHIPRLLLTLQCSHIIYIRHTEPPTQMVSKSGASNRCLGGLKYQVPPEIFKGLNQSTGNSWRARALHMLKIKPGGGWSWKFYLCDPLHRTWFLNSFSSDAVTAIDSTA